MSFLAPGFLAGAAATALGVVLLHFIVTRRPRSLPFPTARFVPEVPIAARTRAIRFGDLALLLLRVLMIMLVGAALARPAFAPRRERIVRIIVADVSGSVASRAETRDSVKAVYRVGDGIIAFDTIATRIASPDSLSRMQRVSSPGSLSAALVAALQLAPSVRAGADSLELVVISPLVDAEYDRATGAIRALWPGRARLLRVAAATENRIQPIVSQTAGGSRPAFAVPRNRIDTMGGVAVDRNVVIATFERRWRFIPDSLSRARVVGRWVDGEPAVIERDSGATCIRSTIVQIDSSGDMLLRPDVIRYRTSLVAPCGSVTSTAGVLPDTSAVSMLAGKGQLASATLFPQPVESDSPLARWLVAIAIVLAVIDMIARRSRKHESVQ